MSRHLAAVLKSGEVFADMNGGEFKASVKASTRATYSLANRMCYFEGLFEKGRAVGDYIVRREDGATYLINTLQAQPKSPGLDYAFVTQCNARAALARPIPVGIGGSTAAAFEVYAEDVLIFMDTATRSLKPGKDGLSAQDITIIHIPKRFGIRKLDRVYILRNGISLYSDECEYFQVDSISTALTPLVGYAGFSGVNIMQLSADNRERTIFEAGGDKKSVNEWDW